MEQSTDVITLVATVTRRCSLVGAFSKQLKVLTDQLQILVRFIEGEMSAVKTGKLTILLKEFNSFLAAIDKPYMPFVNNIRDETYGENLDETTHQTALKAFSERIIDSIVSIGPSNSVNIAEEMEKMVEALESDLLALHHDSKH